MPNRNLWNKNVPRVEYDHRARDTRRRLEYTERLLAKQDAANGFGFLRLLLLLLGNVAGGGRGRGRRTGPPDDQWPCHMEMPRPIPILVRQPASYPPRSRAKPLGRMY
jgi:hypothetical protein